MKKIILLLTGIVMMSTVVNAQRGMIRQESKFVYMTSLGYANGFGNIVLENKTVVNKNPNFQLNQLLGYQFNDYFYMGLGAGVDVWRYTAFVPVYLNFSVNMMSTDICPMAYVNVGYGFKWYISSKPETMDRVIHGATTGPMGEGGLGVRIRFNDKLALVVAACYKTQYSAIRYTIVHDGEQDFSAYSTNSMKHVLYNFAGVRVGLMY